MTPIDHTQLAGTTQAGFVIFFTRTEKEPVGRVFRMITAYIHHNGYPMTEALRKMKWTPLTDVSYAAMWTN